ncbi:MAG: carcinine hydrolase/isopenicillin-N N-acyltransferase family protein [Pseudomonadota bacterium]
MTFEITTEATAEAPDGSERSRLLHYRDTGSGKRFFVLRQKGAFADLCFDHGKLLAEAIEEGVFPEIVAMIGSDLDAPGDWLDWVFSALYARFTEDVLDACSAEFREGVKQLGDGYFAGLDDPRFSVQDVRNACTAIDVGNLATGFTHRLSKWASPENVPTYEYLLGALRRYRRQRSGRNLSVDLALRKGEAAEALTRAAGRRRAGMGCTGFAAAGALCSDTKMLHGRTFDGAFFQWNELPGLFLIDERGTTAEAKHAYAAVGTAGLIYPAGISGVNDAGIACSLHQMSTVRFARGAKAAAFEIAPYVQQRILRGASTLDEAVAIAESLHHFASWTILVSDARTGRALRIEINGAEDERGRYEGRVVASPAAERMVQSNHFLADTMRERFDFFEDRHFTKSVGKWLETHTRFKTVTDRLDRAIQAEDLDTDAAIGLLASHHDSSVDGETRSLGRTVVKAYGLMGNIMRTDPDRSRAADEIWFTPGDRLPGPHAAYAGFAIDWGALTLKPLTDRPRREAQSLPEAYREALEAYVEAFVAMERPRKPNGDLLDRAPDAAEAAEMRRQSIDALDRAIDKAEGAGHLDPPFRYARARLRHLDGQFAAAEQDWAMLRGLIASPTPAATLHPYEKALIETHAAATLAALGKDSASSDALAAARRHGEIVRTTVFGAGGEHPGLKKLEKLIAAIAADGGAASLPDLDFVTVE